MSSPNKSAPLMRPPLSATNSWVISRARELIGYDGYGTVEQWLDNVTNDSKNENNSFSPGERKRGNHTSKSPDHEHGSSRRGHPAGELHDYDPDCTLFSQKTIAEVLEAAAAEIEARHCGEDGGAVSPPGHCDNASLPSSLASSCYGYLPSDSLEGEPLLGDFRSVRDADPRSTTDGKPNASSPPSPSSNSQFLTVPPPAHTAPARARARENTQYQAGKYHHPHPHPHPRPQPRPHTHSHSHDYAFVQPFPHPEIERCASPMPRFHGESPYPVSPDSEVPPPTPAPSVASVSSSTSSYHSAFEMQDIEDVPRWLGLSVSDSGGRRGGPAAAAAPSAAAVVGPVPRRRGKLPLVPRAGRGFHVSRFAAGRGLGSEVPSLS
ncbi:hypothetical protein F5B21DRAFT_351142 [Xylaria acuta]|nr:hypothetical protein F5B21DRAFT_351142 [Xylaria acuta]